MWQEIAIALPGWQEKQMQARRVREREWSVRQID